MYLIAVLDLAIESTDEHPTRLDEHMTSGGQRGSKTAAGLPQIELQLQLCPLNIELASDVRSAQQP